MHVTWGTHREHAAKLRVGLLLTGSNKPDRMYRAIGRAMLYQER